LSVQAIDRLVGSVQPGVALRRLGLDRITYRGNLAHMAVWIVFFAAMTAMDKTDGRNTGDSLPFWEQACTEGRPNACERLVQLESTYCLENAGWACNELGRHYTAGLVTAA